MTRCILFVIVILGMVGCGDEGSSGVVASLPNVVTQETATPSTTSTPTPTPTTTPTPTPTPTVTSSCQPVAGSRGTWQSVIYNAPDASYPQFNDTITVTLQLDWSVTPTSPTYFGPVQIVYYTPASGDIPVNCTYNPTGHLTNQTPMYSGITCPPTLSIAPDDCPQSSLTVSGDWQGLQPGSSPPIGQDQTFTHQ